MAEGSFACQCGCSCLVVDETGLPYPLGTDNFGNEAIVIPHPEQVGCAITEFFFEATTCDAFRAYPLVSPAPFAYEYGVITLSYVDNDDVVVELVKNGVVVGRGRVEAGQLVGAWDAGVLPFNTITGDQVLVRMVSYGTEGPAVNCAMVTCIGFNSATAPVTLSTSLSIPASGTLTPGQTPSDIGISATLDLAGTLYRFNGQGRTTSLWLIRQTADGLSAEWWELGSSAVVAAGGGGGLASITADSPLTGAGTNQSHLHLEAGTADGQVIQWKGSSSSWVKRRVGRTVELAVDAAHGTSNNPTNPKLRFFPVDGTVYLEVVGVWNRATVGALGWEVIDQTGTVKASGSLAANTWSAAIASTSFSVNALDGLAVRYTTTPGTPGYGLMVVGTFVAAT